LPSICEPKSFEFEENGADMQCTASDVPTHFHKTSVIDMLQAVRVNTTPETSPHPKPSPAASHVASGQDHEFHVLLLMYLIRLLDEELKSGWYKFCFLIYCVIIWVYIFHSYVHTITAILFFETISLNLAYRVKLRFAPLN